MDNTKHNELLEEYEKTYRNEYSKITNDPKDFIENLIKTLIKKKIDKKELVKIHQQLYLYYYTKIEIKYTDLVEFFKNPNNNDFRDTLYKIRNNSNFIADIKSLQTDLNQLYRNKNTLKTAIDNFLKDVTKSQCYIENIINIFKLYNNDPIDITFIRPKINKKINEKDRQFEERILDSKNTTEKSFLKTILRIEGDINDEQFAKFNVTSISGQKGINNQKKQLLYFCQLFLEFENNSYKDINDSLNKNYNNLIATLKDHISNFLKEITNENYAIIPTVKNMPVGQDHIATLHKLKKYIVNESLINELIEEYNTYFNSRSKISSELIQQKESEEYKKVAKNKSEEHKKDLTDLIPLSKTKKIQNLLSTSFENIQSKGPEYLNTVIIIIIFLIFLNLFITTYFYFTTSIQATANRSNCGGASLCEAETHRHLFLEDNGNDKARDIYIIIVVIFSIYLLSEIFKSYKNGIGFEDDNNDFKVPIFVLFLYFIFIVGTISGIIENADLNGNPKIINVVSSALFTVYLLIIGIAFYSIKENALDNSKILILTGIILLILIVVEIAVLAEGSKNDLFKGFSGDNYNLINPKFKANTALHIIFLVFYIIFFAVVLGFNKNIKSLHIWGLVFLAFILFTLFTFILLASLDFKNTTRDKYLQNITGSTLGMQYFVLLAPLVCLSFFKSANAIKLIVLYYAILFIIYLFYVYFVNHSNETGILSLESFQLYNWASEDKNEKEKGPDSKSNHKKDLNKVNTFFVAVLLIILIVISGLNKDPNLDNTIYGIIVFILASYITGIVYLLYNELFPIQQASFKYKKNLVDINNEISQHIKVEEEEHTIDKNKIRVFKIASNADELKDIHDKIKQSRNNGTTGKEKHMKNIRDIFSEISPKGSSYEDYRSQSIDQMQYEEYIYRFFSVWTNTEFKFQESFGETIFGDNNFSSYTKVGEGNSNENQSYKLYNSIILKLPKNKAELIQYAEENNINISSLIKNTEADTFIQEVFKIPKTNNIEYVIKKNYKYVTGEEGEIQKYKVLSDKELDCLYYKEVTNDTEQNNEKLEESIKDIKNITNVKTLTITNIATATTEKYNQNKDTPDKTIYKLNQDIFDHYKNNHTKGIVCIELADGKKYKNILHSEITSTKYDKLKPAFYTIGYDYKNYTYNDEDENHQQMNKDTAYSIPARYYACSYLNYFPNEDGSMSKVKFAKNIKEDNYNPLNTKNTIIDRIAKSYNENAKETKIQLAPEKFQFLLVFLVILAIILLMFLFNIIKKYFTGDVYTPQMYVLGILAVFLTIFIFGEVIFARIK